VNDTIHVAYTLYYHTACGVDWAPDVVYVAARVAWGLRLRCSSIAVAAADVCALASCCAGWWQGCVAYNSLAGRYYAPGRAIMLRCLMSSSPLGVDSGVLCRCCGLFV